MSVSWPIRVSFLRSHFNIKLNVLSEKLKNNTTLIELPGINFYYSKRRNVVESKRIKICGRKVVIYYKNYATRPISIL